MSDTTTSPNMGLVIPTTSVQTGPNWADNYNADLSIIDGHNHASGSGVQINPAGILINSDLAFNTNNLITVRSTRYTAQSAPLSAGTDLGCTYVSGVDLWYNDVNGNQVKLTSGGLVNATSSGISSGTASAAFSGSILVVNANTNLPANVQCGSVLLGNNTVNSKFCTLSPPAAMAANFGLTLPSVPASQSFVSLDASGNFSGYASVSGGIVAANIAAGTITGTEMATNNNYPGKLNKVAGHAIVASPNPNTNGLILIRGYINANGTINQGEGFSAAKNSTGNYTITWTSAFSDNASITLTGVGAIVTFNITSTTTSASFTVSTGQIIAGTPITPVDSAFMFVAVGQGA